MNQDAMKLPDEYLMLRQPKKVCEVAFIKKGTEHVMFSGGRVAAKKYLTNLRRGIGWEGVRAFNHKEKGRGSIVELT